jgi:hypothetical protein
MLLKLAGILDSQAGAPLAQTRRSLRSWYLLVRECARPTLGLPVHEAWKNEAEWLKAVAPAHSADTCEGCSRRDWFFMDRSHSGREPSPLLSGQELVRVLEGMAQVIRHHGRDEQGASGMCSQAWLAALRRELYLSARVTLDAAPPQGAASSESELSVRVGKLVVLFEQEPRAQRGLS